MKSMKERILDVGFLLVVLAIGLGAYALYNQILAHKAQDDALINILSTQDKVQLEQRCVATGFVKAETK